MRHDTVNYLAVGGFVLAVLAALLVVLGLITGRTGGTDSYHSFYDNVAGIKFGTLVSYEGYHIGQVDGIAPLPGSDGMRYRVNYALRKDWKIPTESVARIVSTGLLSAVSIDIQEGSGNTFLAPGDEIRGEGAVDLFVTIADAASKISALTDQGIRPLVERVSTGLIALIEQSQASMPDILAHLESVGSKLDRGADRIPRILGELEAMAGKLNQSATRIQDVVNDTNRDHVTRFLSDLNTALAKLDKLLDEYHAVIADNKSNLRESSASLRASLRAISEHIDAFTYNMEGASRNMNEFSRRIRDNPQLLLGVGSAPVDQGGATR